MLNLTGSRKFLMMDDILELLYWYTFVVPPPQVFQPPLLIHLMLANWDFALLIDHFSAVHLAVSS